MTANIAHQRHSFKKIKDGESAQRIALGDGFLEDAFGRLRVSSPHTIFDSKQIHDNHPLFWDDQEETGSGTTSTYTKATASTTISVSANTAGKRTRQTFERFNYTPGKSHLVMFTGIIGAGGSGITQEIIYGDESNGVGFGVVDGVLRVFARSSTSGSAVDNPTNQSDWNLDKMDGTGISGVTLDLTLVQFWFLDFEWLGAGRVRFGLFIGGEPVYVHEILNANVATVIYMSTPNLPLRYSIENDGTGAAASLVQLCNSVITEGDFLDLGDNRYASNGITFINANTAGLIYALCAIKLKSTHLDASVKIVDISVMSITSTDFEWLLILNPTSASALTFNDETNSSLQFAVGENSDPSASTLTGGTQVAGGYIKADKSTGDVSQDLDSILTLGSKIDGTPDEIYLAVRPIGANANVVGGFTYKDIV